MVPAAFVVLDALPLGRSGKLDDGALPAPVWERLSSGLPTPPRDPLEEVLAQIWSELLGVREIGIDDDFFTLGGHSLLATRLVSRIRDRLGVELALRTVFEAPTVAKLARLLPRAAGTTAPPLAPADRSAALPLSFAQQRLWFLDRLVPENPFYNMSSALALRGGLDAGALVRAFARVVERHEALRTRFESHSGRPRQVIAPPRAPRVPMVDLGRLPQERRRRRLERLAAQTGRRPFDLACGPLLRALLVRLSAREHVLVLAIHHIVSDGWSLGVLAHELTAFYRADVRGEPPAFETLPIQYGDFALWQRRWLSGPVLDALLDYWRRQLAGTPASLALPLDRPRPSVETFRGTTEPLRLPATLARRLEARGRDAGATPSMALLAAFKALLGRFSGQHDILVGTAVANRNRSEVEGLIGFFVNNLVLRTRLDGRPSFHRLLERVRETALGAYSHQDLPFEKLVEELAPERHLSGNPLCQVMYGFQNFPRPRLEVPGLEIRPAAGVRPDTGTSKFDLTLFLHPVGEELGGFFEYNLDLFDAVTMRRLADAWRHMLRAAAVDPERPFEELPLLGAGQRHQLRTEWNDDAGRRPPGQCFHRLVAERTASWPDALAAVDGERRLSYGELVRLARRLARRLRRQGVDVETVVGLEARRSLETLVAILGVLEAGGAYLPLDPAYPAARRRYMAEDAGVDLVLAPDRVLEILGEGDGGGDADGPEPAAAAVSPQNLAYVIYTSGSTGTPRGVAVRHASMVLMAEAERQRFGVVAGQRILHVTSLSFDISVSEISLAWVSGATLVIAGDEERMPGPALYRLARRQRVSVVNVTPSVLAVLEPAALPELVTVIAGGEALPPEQVERWGAGRRLFNAYGPTEATVSTAVERCRPGQGGVAIGRPLAHAAAYLLDDRLALVPPGVVGEIHIGGRGLARGYLGRPADTAARFLPDLRAGRPGERLYRTGDLARHAADGRLLFLRRRDDQVKVRGLRIESGEIETALGRHEAVRHAVVAVRDTAGAAGAASSDRRITAYVVARREERGSETRAGGREQRIAEWEQIFDDLYERAQGTSDSSSGDSRADFTGWDSSYTGAPIPDEEMREWQRETVARIRSLAPRSVLEIGCGTGLLLVPLAPTVERYLGTDVSAAALQDLRRQLAAAPQDLGHVELHHLGAHQLDEIEAGSVDTVILNSVCQYFPDAGYLAEVLTGAARLLAPDGRMFVGDVRSLPLLEAFHTSLELADVPSRLEVAELRRRIRERTSRESELCVAPGFFETLCERVENLGRAEIRLKWGRAHNEVTAFRYDVVIQARPIEVPIAAGRRLDWRGAGFDFEGAARLLRLEKPPVLTFTGVPNPRVERAAAAVELLRQADATARVGPLRDRLEAAELTGVEPEAWRSLAEELGYEVDLDAGAGARDGAYEAVFRRLAVPASPRPVSAGLRSVAASVPDAMPATETLPWSAYTNRPSSVGEHQRLAAELRRCAAETLPEFMLPSAFVFLEEIPLTPGGKVDRRALPEPERSRSGSAAFAAPRGPVEERLAELWREVLGIERVGRRDDFFELGGHSLLATQVISRIAAAWAVELPLRAVFELRTLEELAGRIEEAAGRTATGSTATAAGPPIMPVPRVPPPPLSFAQERLWFIDQLEPLSTAYNMPLALVAGGGLNAALLTASLGEIVRRHEVLRTSFPAVDGEGVQVIAEAVPFFLPLADLRALPAGRRPGEARRLARREARQPFVLARETPLRARLVALDELEHVVLLTLHHIAGDGWSMGILRRELRAIYEALESGRPAPLEALPVQYADYAVWQRRRLGELFEHQLAYWRQQLAGVAPLFELATDRPRPALRTSRGAAVRRRWPRSFTSGVEQLGRRRGATLFMTLLAALAVLLERWSGQSDVICATAVANRNRVEIEGLIGLFVNNLVLRIDLEGGPSFAELPFAELLERAREVTLEAFAHQDLPFEKLVEELRPRRSLSHTPLFQVMLNLQNAPRAAPELSGIALSPAGVATTTAKLDLTISVTPDEDGLAVELEYSADLFDPVSMRRWSAHWRNILAAAVKRPEIPWPQLALLAPAQRHQLVQEWNDRPAVAPPAGLPPACLPDLLAAQTERTPAAVAVVSDDVALSYRELGRRSSRLAGALCRRGVRPEVLVAVCLERSADLVVALFAVLEAGGAYLPLDPAYPRRRLELMTSDADAALLVTRRGLLPELSDTLPALCIDRRTPDAAAATEFHPALEPRRPALEPRHPAYVLYTSGSTGRPKGVQVSHGALAALLAGLRQRPGLGAGDVLLAVTSLSFDVAAAEIFLPLVSGARLEIAATATTADGDALGEHLGRCRASVMSATPASWRLLLEARWQGARGQGARRQGARGLRAWCSGRGAGGGVGGTARRARRRGVEPLRSHRGHRVLDPRARRRRRHRRPAGGRHDGGSL